MKKEVVETKKVEWNVVIGVIFTIVMILFGLHGPVLMVLSLLGVWEPPIFLVVTSVLSILFDAFFIATLG